MERQGTATAKSGRASYHIMFFLFSFLPQRVVLLRLPGLSLTDFLWYTWGCAIPLATAVGETSTRRNNVCLLLYFLYGVCRTGDNLLMGIVVAVYESLLFFAERLRPRYSVDREPTRHVRYPLSLQVSGREVYQQRRRVYFNLPQLPTHSAWPDRYLPRLYKYVRSFISEVVRGSHPVRSQARHTSRVSHPIGVWPTVDQDCYAGGLAS